MRNTAGGTEEAKTARGFCMVQCVQHSRMGRTLQKERAGTTSLLTHRSSQCSNVHATADVSDQQLRLMPPSFCNSATHRTFLVTRSDNPSRSTKYQKEMIIVSQKMKIGKEGSSTSTAVSTHTKIHQIIHVDRLEIFRQ